MRVLKAFLVAAAAAVAPVSFFIACSGGNTTGTTDGGGDVNTSDGFNKHPDTGGSSGGSSSGGADAAPCTMTGNDDLAVTAAAAFPPGPVPGVAVRAESAAGCAEGMTGPDGVAHVKVDISKGPYDVTLAGGMVTFGDGGTPAAISAVSVLGVTKAPMPGPVLVYPEAALMNFGQTNVTGKVTVPAQYMVDAGGADGGTWRVFIDGWDFQTVVQPATLGTYATMYQYDYQTAGTANATPLPLAGMLVDPTDTIVTGVYTAATPRTGQKMGIDVDFTMGPLTPTTTTLTLQFPTGGVVPVTELNMIGNPAGSNASIGNAIVIKLTNKEATAEQFCGIGNVTLPDATGKSTLTLQTFPAPMNPDVAEAVLFGNNYAAFVQPHNLMSGATETIGQVNTMTTTPGPNGDLSDVTFSVDGTGYDTAIITIDNGKTGTSAVGYWTIYASSGKITNQKMPNLPSSVALTDFVASGTVSASLQLEKYRMGAPPPWGTTQTGPDFEQIISEQAGKSTTLNASGR